MKRRRRFPPNVGEFEKRPGQWVMRYRKTGQRTYYFKSKFGTAEFEAELDACRRGIAAPRIQPGEGRYRPGTISHAVLLYYGSKGFLGIAASTQATYRGILDRFCREHGEKSISTVQAKHIEAILAGMVDRKSAANNLLDRLKALMKWAVKNGLRPTNPTDGIEPFKIKGGGFYSWTDQDIAKYEARHQPGTRARLAMALLLYTGQRRSDVVKLGRQHVASDHIRVVQQKTGTPLEIPIMPELRDELRRAGKGSQMAFLVTEYGLPFTAAGFGGWFRTQCDLAGLPKCSAHGLRKAAARRFAEAGCTAPQIASYTGHKSLREVQRYIDDANQKTLAGQARAAMSKQRKTGTDLATKPKSGSQNAR